MHDFYALLIRRSEGLGEIMQTAAFSAGLILSATLAMADSVQDAIRADPVSAFTTMIGLQYERDLQGLAWEHEGESWDRPTDARSISTCYHQHEGLSFDDINSDSVTDYLQFLSSYYYFASKNLANKGYPAPVWKDALDEYIVDLVSTAATGAPIFGEGGSLLGGADFENRLASALDFYDAQNLRPRPFQDYETSALGCGGDPSYSAYLVTNPTGGSIFRLRRFSVKLCQAMGFEPFSESCPGDLTPPNQPVDIGTYAFLIYWPEGAISCGTVPIDILSDSIPTVELNPPKGLCDGWN